MSGRARRPREEKNESYVEQRPKHPSFSLGSGSQESGSCPDVHEILGRSRTRHSWKLEDLSCRAGRGRPIFKIATRELLPFQKRSQSSKVQESPTW